MSAALSAVSEPRPRLQVAVQAADAARRRRLLGVVAGAGHAVVAATDADVVLVDGPADLVGPGKILFLGGGGDHPGVLPTDATPAQIDAGLRAVAAGLQVRVPGRPGGFAMVTDPAQPLLTPREMQVLASVGAGLSNKAAARALGISQHTVKFHLEAIYAKLGATGRAEAVAKGLRRGLIEV